MSQETITFRVDSNKRKALDELAVSLERDRNDVLNEAIDYYLDMQRRQIEEIHRAVAEANRGNFTSDEEVKAVFAKLTHES